MTAVVMTTCVPCAVEAHESCAGHTVTLGLRPSEPCRCTCTALDEGELREIEAVARGERVWRYR